MIEKLNKMLIVSGVAVVLTVSGSFAKGPGAKKAGPNLYKGAGIGPEVSQEAKSLKNTENKTDFGKNVRESARDKERIELHKE